MRAEYHCEMIRFLSAEWLSEAGHALEASDPLPRDVEMVIQQRVHNTPDGNTDYAMILSGRSITLEVGLVDDPTVTFSQDWATAVAIARGEISAQAAFMTGKVSLGGNTSILVAEHDLLVDVDDLLADLRTRTTFPDA